MPLAALRDFLRLESAGGLVLLAAAALAILCANGPLADLYHRLLDLPIGVRLGGLGMEESLSHWIDDGLMTIFFLVVGLEIKREFLAGELASPARAALPAIAALGGMAVPALLYVLVNRAAPETFPGWAIPTATDIAFAIGVLSLLGPRVPHALKIFLLALAILDDLGAILIIALFYGGDLHLPALGAAGGVLLLLILLNRLGVRALPAYVLGGLLLWAFLLRSGIHATLAGVALAMTIPLGQKGEASLLHRLEAALHPFVTFFVMPVFAFANAGISLHGLSLADLAMPPTPGIALGLLLGKQAGVMLALLLVVGLGLCRKPAGASWAQIYGVSVLTGIGFTMSLFIGGLAFADAAHEAAVRLGVLSGSLAAALLGYAILRAVSPPVRA